MSTFEYKAMDGVGKLVLGRIEASNDDDLELRLTRMGLDLITFKTAGRTPPGMAQTPGRATRNWLPFVFTSNN